jgi:ubiquinone/menaquinone biosynthesis C-methylase UbiE
MDHREAGRYWDDNADAWTELARAGYDVYRDHLNTPAFVAALPDVTGLSGLDIGCGEGHNTRMLADRGARMTAIDISERFIAHAQQAESEGPKGIDYRVASAVALPFEDAAFDFATGFMSFMDVPETDLVLAEASRVLKPCGFVQFSIAHPCFTTPHRRNLRDASGWTYAIEVGGYFADGSDEVSEWLFSAAPPEAKRGLREFQTPLFRRTLSRWLNLVFDSGLRLEYVGEPRPTDEAVHRCPAVQDAQLVAYFLHIRARKPE